MMMGHDGPLLLNRILFLRPHTQVRVHKLVYIFTQPTWSSTAWARMGGWMVELEASPSYPPTYLHTWGTNNRSPMDTAYQICLSQTTRAHAPSSTPALYVITVRPHRSQVLPSSSLQRGVRSSASAGPDWTPRPASLSFPLPAMRPVEPPTPHSKTGVVGHSTSTEGWG